MEHISKFLKKHEDKISEEICPACKQNKLNADEVMNSLSRYCKKYICSSCGTREAFEGDFWHGNAQFGEVREGTK